MRAVSEATRQIVEFEELVSRLDRINDHHHHRNIQASPSLLTQLSSTLTSSSLSTTSGSIDRHGPVDKGRRNSSSTVGEPYVTDITESNCRSTKSLSNSSNYVAFSGNSQNNSHQIRQQDATPHTNNNSSSTTIPDQPNIYGSQRSDLHSSDRLHVSYSGNSSGSSSYSPYYPPTIDIDNTRASSFPVNGTTNCRNYYEFLSPRSLQQQREQIPHRENSQEKRVRVNIGIDEDLRMILEMDPSIVDRQPPTPPPMPPRRPPPPPPPLPPTQHAVGNSNCSLPLQGTSGSRVTGASSSSANNDNTRTQADQATSGMLTTSSTTSLLVGRPPRATRPQGWYRTPRD